MDSPKIFLANKIVNPNTSRVRSALLGAAYGIPAIMVSNWAKQRTVTPKTILIGAGTGMGLGLLLNEINRQYFMDHFKKEGSLGGKLIKDIKQPAELTMRGVTDPRIVRWNAVKKIISPSAPSSLPTIKQGSVAKTLGTGMLAAGLSAMPMKAIAQDTVKVVKDSVRTPTTILKATTGKDMTFGKLKHLFLIEAQKKPR